MLRDTYYTRLIATLILLGVGLYAANYFGLSLPVKSSFSNVTSELSVVGEGKVDITPDTAYVDLGILIEKAASAQEAQNMVSEKNNALLNALKSLGVKEEDIKTSNFSVNPNYNFVEGRNNIDGYTANVTISIKVPEIALAEKVVAAATQVGVNQVNGIRFEVDMPEKYREEARTKAINNAKEEAQKLANSLGIRLGRVTNIVESSPSYPPLYYSEKSVAVGRGGDMVQPELSPGTQIITSTVTLFFEKR